MKDNIFKEILKRFECQTGSDLENVALISSYRQYEACISVDLNSLDDSLKVDYFGINTKKGWKELIYSKEQYKALCDVMDMNINLIEERIKEENDTTGAFDDDDYEHFTNLIYGG